MNNMPYIEIYKRFCKLAATDDAIFHSFKRHPDYVPMLEHVSPDQGLQYLNVILDRKFEVIEKFRENDKFGFPNTTTYKLVGEFSPTTLRYVKVLSDIIEMYETIDNDNIIELGGGYGGQCKIISTMFNYKSYTILDLPEVTGLINRYLKTTEVPNASAITLQELQDSTYDLFISNYAFTELPRRLQQTYIDRVINNSEHGYITCNFNSEEYGIPSMSKDEFLNKIHHKYLILDEVPNTHPANFLLVW